MDRLLRLASLLPALSLGACSGSSTPHPLDGSAGPDIAFAAPDLAPLPDLAPPADLVMVNHVQVSFPTVAGTKADILFMVDNSSGMDAMQAELRNRLPQMFQTFQALANGGAYSDLQIGVVTSDYGAGASGAPGCTPSGPMGGGDQAKLQAIGKKAAVNCQAPVGANFIKYRYGKAGAAHNLPANQDLATTLGCMASVGSSGCGFEHQLESVHAVLHGNIPENQGFLRPDAQLLVVLVTNEDDASAPPDTDVFDKNKVAQYGYLDSYSRQTRFAILCGNPPIFPPYGPSNGPLAMCVPAPNPDGMIGPGKQFDVKRYIDFFTRPRAQGGVKDNPADVALIAIDAPETPVEVVLSNPGTQVGQPYVLCGQLNENSNPPCVPVLQRSCVNPQNTAFYGDPALRINRVVNAAARHAITSICESDYTPVLSGIAQLLGPPASDPGCVPAALARGDGGTPVADCVVEDVRHNLDGTTTRTALPRCAANDANTPCWKVESKPACAGQSPDGVGLTVLRGGQPPAGDTVEATCIAE